MSAIFGILSLDGTPVQATQITRMRDKVTRYGAEHAERFFGSALGMGCCLSDFGAHTQHDVPVLERDGMALVCDALLWNRTELAEELGLACDTATQAILLKAYQTWGADCPNHINGDFAFAVWDKTKNRLFLARDHLGVRPLYYAFIGTTFAFATDIRALLCLPFVGKRPDETMLYARLGGVYYMDPVDSHFAQVKRLPQAHTLRVGADGLSLTRYWTPGAHQKIRFDTEAEYAKALYTIVDDAIRRRVRGVAGKVGAELSGGLDSSVIAILANREMQKTGAELECLTSWSPPYSLVEQKPQDERRLVDAVCRQEGFRCSYADPGQTPRAQDDVHAMMRAGVERLSAQGARCILSGWGGDDAISLRAGLYQLLLHGHIRYFFGQAARLSKGSPLRFVKVVAANTVKQWFRPYARFGRENKGIMGIVNGDFRRRMQRRFRREPHPFRTHPEKNILRGAIQTRTELSAWMDTACGVTHLYPLLDYRVVDFAFSIPRTLYVKNGINRYVFRKAFEGILPPEHADYHIKDDPAKTAYAFDRLTKEFLHQFAGRLNRTLFQPYIDWNRLEQAIENPDVPDPMRQYAMLFLKLQYCLDLQQELESAAEEI